MKWFLILIASLTPMLVLAKKPFERSAKQITVHPPSDSIFSLIENAFINNEYLLAHQFADAAYAEAVLTGKSREKTIARFWKAKVDYYSHNLSPNAQKTLYKEIHQTMYPTILATAPELLPELLHLQQSLAENLNLHTENALPDSLSKANKKQQLYAPNQPPKTRKKETGQSEITNGIAEDPQFQVIGKPRKANNSSLKQIPNNKESATNTHPSTPVPIQATKLNQEISTLTNIVRTQTRYINYLLALSSFVAFLTIGIFILYFRTKN